MDAGTTVAGYRLVRLVGRGASCQVFLARPAHRAAVPHARPENVAVKIVPATERSRGEAEVLALRSVTSEHVVGLVDVATLADGGLCLVQSLGSRGTAAALLARRGSLTPGETVTLVASVLRGVGDLHEAGVAHGALDLSHVLLDGAGRPMLGGLGCSQPLSGASTATGRRGGSLREQDLVRVARIAQALHDPVEDRGRASDGRWAAWMDLLDAAIHGESDLTAHDLADRLLEVADAAPLADVVDPAAAEDGRLLAEDARAASRSATGDVGRGAASRGTGTRRAGSGATPRRRHRATSTRSGASWAARVRASRAAAARDLATVRTRIWFLGAAALALLAAAVVALPLATGTARGAPVDGEAASVSATPASAFDPEPTATPTDAATATREGPDAARTADADDRATSADDVEVAVPALLRLRAACLRDADAACLGRADQPGSAVEDADLARIAAGGEDARDEASLHEADERGPAQHLGDSALIELRSVGGPGGTETPAASGPGRRTASLLVVRGEAGWRIRDLMDDR